MKRTSIIILLAAWALFGCATLPTDVERPLSHAITDTQDSTLGKYVAVRQTDHPGHCP